MENQTVNEGKTAAIIAYITIFGTIIAYILNAGKKSVIQIRHCFSVKILSYMTHHLKYAL